MRRRRLHKSPLLRCKTISTHTSSARFWILSKPLHKALVCHLGNSKDCRGKSSPSRARRRKL